ncbi:hypothetical protein GURKE_00450 [Brevundimonas phage vB_BpoS-Gurke]|uniref:Lipoprotein n=1 Tax=Brevundimonas phage vB_BpoS-Gurke TaxID=2948599 RepID=A0A9E7N3X9_9CAUD|nr:hypothetical protein GURKE_00450 [Brevundimonas phage vB_BpoS-Gurke]
MKRVAIIAAALLLSGCTVNERTARGALEANGMRDIQLSGPAIFGCSEDDSFTRKFEATTLSGSRVRGVVCQGFLKGATVRTTKVIRR